MLALLIILYEVDKYLDLWRGRILANIPSRYVFRRMWYACYLGVRRVALKIHTTVAEIITYSQLRRRARRSLLQPVDLAFLPPRPSAVRRNSRTEVGYALDQH